MTTTNRRGGIFGLNPFYNSLAADSFEANGLQVNGNGHITGVLTVDGSVIVNGMSLGGLMLQGTWDANTNTPDLPAMTPTNNHFWIVSVSGTTTLGSISDWSVNDWALYINDGWTKISAGDRSVYSTLDIGDMTLTGSTITTNSPATSVTITPGTDGLIVPSGISADAITGTSGTGTGSFHILTGGSETMTLDENNRVGINVTTPLSALHIKGPVDDTPNETGFHFGMSSDNTSWAAQKISSTTGGVIDFQNGTDASQHSGRIQYTHNNNKMTFRTNATARMTLDGNGHIGINTENPLSPLHVRGDIDGSPSVSGVHLGTSSSGTYAAIELSATAGGYIDFQNTAEGNDYQGRIRYDQSNNSMIFYTAAASRMTLASDGKLGLGVSSPLSGLQVTGDIDTSPATSGVHLGQTGTLTGALLSGTGGGFLSFHDGDGTHTYSGRINYVHSTNTMTFDTNGTTRLTLDGSGNVTVSGNLLTTGTFSPNGNVTVTGSLTASGSITSTGGSITANNFFFGEGDSVGYIANAESGNGQLDLIGGTTAQQGARIELFGPTKPGGLGGIMNFKTGASGSSNNRMSIKANGTIIVGNTTADPNGLFDVAGTLTLTNTSDATKFWSLHTETTNSDLMFMQGTDERVHISSLGQVTCMGSAFGFLPQGEDGLQLYHQTITGTGADISTIGSYKSTGDSDIAFYTNSDSAAATEKMRIKDTGAVGIRVTNPAYTLDLGSAEETNGYSLRVRSNATATTARVQFTTANGATQNGFINVSDDQHLSFGTVSEVCRALNDKTFCIGAQSNPTAAKLFVRNDDSSNADIVTRIEAGSPSSPNTSNNARLALVSKGTGTFPFPAFANVCEIRSLGQGNAGSVLSFFTTVSGALAERMRVNENGRACINTTAEFNNAPLSVAAAGVAVGNANVAGQFRRMHMDASHNLVFTNTTNTPALSAAGVWTDASDRNFKRDIEDLKYGMDEVKKLTPRSYHMKNCKTDDAPHIGLIAQELKEIIPECVFGEEGAMSIGYGGLTAVLVNAVKELSQRIESLENSISNNVT